MVPLRETALVLHNEPSNEPRAIELWGCADSFWGTRSKHFPVPSLEASAPVLVMWSSNRSEQSWREIRAISGFGLRDSVIPEDPLSVLPKGRGSHERVIGFRCVRTQWEYSALAVNTAKGCSWRCFLCILYVRYYSNHFMLKHIQNIPPRISH